MSSPADPRRHSSAQAVSDGTRYTATTSRGRSFRQSARDSTTAAWVSSSQTASRARTRSAAARCTTDARCRRLATPTRGLNRRALDESAVTVTSSSSTTARAANGRPCSTTQPSTARR
ncbi:hypothetical protein GCM10010441_11810 [Kitasatospora paracochleata]